MSPQCLNTAEALNTLPETAWKPRLYRAAVSVERAALEELKKSGAVFRAHDTLRGQLEELLVGRRPAEKDKLTVPDLRALVDTHLQGTPIEEYGTWVYYPWSGRLVHVLPKTEFREVRSSRNRYLISPEEQCRLGAACIGVVGLSVGRAVLSVLAREGIGGTFHLADFDHLELSNMNRLEAGVEDLSVPKVVLAARQLFAMDPYLNVRIFPQGLREDKFDAFFASHDRLDLLIEECDDLFVKMLARERARALGIPVVMSTSDRGLVDIELFDREPGRRILHGLLDQVDAQSVRQLTNKDKVPYVMDVLDPDRMSSRMLASLVEVGETIVTWPQLASAVALGGAIVADVARRILLGQMNASGRFYVDLAELVADQTAWTPTPKQRNSVDTAVSAVLTGTDTTNLERHAAKITAEEVKALVTYAVHAPSGGNSQPWRFVYRDTTLECHHDPQHSALDFHGWYSQLALGAAVENLLLAAPSLHIDAVCRLFPPRCESTLVCEVDLQRTTAQPQMDPLFAQILRRMTNRRMGHRTALQPGDAETLLCVAKEAQVELRLITSPEKLADVGKLLGQVDQIVMLEPEYHAALMSELRWTPEEAQRTRDGIDVQSLELSTLDRVALDIVARPGVMAVLGRLGRGNALGTLTRKWIDGSSAVGLLLVGGPAENRYFYGGRALQRVWLTATSRGIGLQPITALTALHARVMYEPHSLSSSARSAFTTLLPQYAELFGSLDALTDVILFRLHREGMPAVRSLRRPVEEILSFVEQA